MMDDLLTIASLAGFGWMAFYTFRLAWRNRNDVDMDCDE